MCKDNECAGTSASLPITFFTPNTVIEHRLVLYVSSIVSQATILAPVARKFAMTGLFVHLRNRSQITPLMLLV